MTHAPILLVGLDSDVAPNVIAPLRAGGYQVQIGSVADIRARAWSAVISGPAVAGLGGLNLLAALADSAQHAPPLLLLGEPAALAGLESGAHCRTLAQPFEPVDLLNAVRALLASTVGPADTIGSADAEAATPLPGEEEFFQAVALHAESYQGAGSAKRVFVACLRLHELDFYRARLSRAAFLAIERQLLMMVRADDAFVAETQGRRGAGELLLAFAAVSSHQAHEQLRALSDRIARHTFRLPGQQTSLTPVMGYAGGAGVPNAHALVEQARQAAVQAASRLDLQPTLYRPAIGSRPRPFWSWLTRVNGLVPAHYQISFQYGVSLILGMGLPYAVYALLGALGWDITHQVYLFVVAVLALTAASIWAEGMLALRPMHPPAEPAKPYPSASAIIAAYLPNEAPIIEATIEAFLRLQYPAALQIILAYNTPTDMAIEGRLREIAAAHPNFVPMRIAGSTSKAQNVNAALPYATGEFTAVFDADHQPDPDSFRRAWRWLSHGADVVQGHCLIRNGDASWVAKMIAIEFEQIYAVNHPGRARLHGFGIFGGSNGYWRTDLLRQLRMHGFMLTEDIDSSLRAVIGGRKIVSDPYLVSRELAPETMDALTKQRLRWAQGWFQIAKKWTLPALRSPRLNWQQKLGMLQLLVLREAFPWVSMQIVPLVAYWAVQAGSLWRLDWLVPIFVVTTLFTLSTGPGQILFTYRLADPQIKRHWRWFFFYLWTSTLFYSGQKNAWNRIAHLKEAMGETTWNVTARTSVKK